MHKIRIPDSGRIICEVYIKRYDSPLMQAIEFKIDTGADFSTVSKDTLLRLGYTTDWIDKNKKISKQPISVASGEEIESYYINLPKINIYGIEGTDYPFGILMDKSSEYPKPSCKGCKYTEAKKFDYRMLLGNDILSCFKTEIDWDNNSINLERRRSLDARNRLYPDRQLHDIEVFREITQTGFDQ